MGYAPIFKTASLSRSPEILSDATGYFLTTKNTDFRLGTLFALAISMPKTVT
jgi:hypothetical protein